LSRSQFDWLTARPVAHRGYHDPAKGRIENISAVAAAVARRFAVEVDLQLSADGEIVVFHDDTLDRLTEASGRVDRLSLAALRAARFRDSNQQIPTLDEVLEEVGGRVPLFLELKSNWNFDRRLEEAVAKMLASYVGPIAVMSFDPFAVRAIRRLIPHMPSGLVAGHFVSTEEHPVPAHYLFAFRHLLAASFALPYFIAYDVSYLPASAPLMIRHAFGLPLLTWTVRTEAERQVASRWADQIIFEGFDPDCSCQIACALAASR
jgi:glycerophosphoryl diester phosphodiesterase